MKPRNQSIYDASSGFITIKNPKGEIVFERQARTPEMALREFEYAVRAWFSCMDKPTRHQAIEYALEHLDTEFSPNAEPK